MARQLRDSFSGSLAETGSKPSIFSPKLVGLMRRAALSSALATGMGMGALAYAHVESKRPTLRNYRVPISPRPGFTSLKILHISDLHLYPGQNFIPRFLRRVVEENEIDLVLSTGDNLGHGDSLPQLLETYDPLLKLPGAFVLGSNDYYSPLSKSWLSYLKSNRSEEDQWKSRRDQPDLPWVEFVSHLQGGGWVDLSNRADSLRVQEGQTEVALIGVDDPHIRRDRMPTPPASWFDPASVRLGLTHAPYLRVVNEMVNEKSDLVCAGHTHGGQVRIPGVGALITNSDIPRKYASGIHRWPEDAPAQDLSWLHVSAGLGTSPYAPIRFACRPEVSLIELVNADQF